MTTRLNVSIKDKIVSNAIKQAGIPTKEEALEKRRAEWAEAVRIHAIGGKQEAAKMERLRKRLRKSLDDAPRKLVKEDDPIRRDYDILVNVGGLAYRAYFHGGTDYKHSALVWKITPYQCTVEAGHALADEFHEIESQANAIREERDTIYSNVRAALDGVRTVKRLLEEWPEAKDLLPSDMSEEKKHLPAVRREELNSMIGLPA